MSKRIKMKLKKGHQVIVIAGKDKGKVGEIVKVLPENNKLIISNINTVKKHAKPTQTSKGGIIVKSMPINASNVAFYDPKDKVASRIGYKILDNGKKERFSKKSGEIIG